MLRTNHNRIGWVLVLILLLSCGSDQNTAVETHTVKRGEFVNSVTVTGELAAINSKLITAPPISWRFGALKITKIVDDGEQVEKGELLIQFDKAEIEKHIADAKSELEIAEAELRKAQANHQSESESLEIDLEVAGLSHKIAALKLEQAAFEAEIDRKKLELQLEEAAINLQKAEQELENKKRVNLEEINKRKLKIQQVQAKLEDARETLAKLTVIAPSPGIAILRKHWSTRAKFQVDDQPWPGMQMIGLPDLSRMKAQVQINEVDIAKIEIDQKAVIRMDAYPDTSFEARVSEISTLARNKSRDSKVKVFDATAILEGSNERLMPGMTISCEIVVDRVPDTLFVPLEALFRKDGETIVYARSGSSFEPHKVVASAENDNYVIISSGIEAGDQIALTDPTTTRLDGVGSGSKKEDLR